TRGGGQYHARAAGRTAARVRLGRWRAPALAFCGVVAVVAFVTPVSVIVYWLARGMAEGESVGLTARVVQNSVQVAAGGAALSAAASLPLAWAAVRHPGRASTLMERAAYSGQGLPAITIALAMVFFATRLVTPLYQTLGLLMFAYMVRFLPEALGATRTGLLQVNPNAEEAARSLGAGTARTFFRITAPQMLPNMSAGMLLVFLTIMKELPITLLLSPTGYDTFATTIWASASEAFFAKAALPSLVLLLLSAVAVLVMLRRERGTS
ncbi:MAG: ABC transporter permease, partial [Dehalococcoidia bacterium]